MNVVGDGASRESSAESYWSWAGLINYRHIAMSTPRMVFPFVPLLYIDIFARIHEDTLLLP
jgi:hypothetical protein